MSRNVADNAIEPYPRVDALFEPHQQFTKFLVRVGLESTIIQPLFRHRPRHHSVWVKLHLVHAKFGRVKYITVKGNTKQAQNNKIQTFKPFCDVNLSCSCNIQATNHIQVTDPANYQNYTHASISRSIRKLLPGRSGIKCPSTLNPQSRSLVIASTASWRVWPATTHKIKP